MFSFIVQARVIPSKHVHCTFQVCVFSELATVNQQHLSDKIMLGLWVRIPLGGMDVCLL